MQAWELKLRVRRFAVEGRLNDYRTRHSELVDERKRSPEGGPAWKKKSDKMCLLRGWIRRELAELEFIKMMANAGPIVGNRMVLHVRDGMTKKVRPGPSIIDIMTRVMERHRETAKECEDDSAIATEHHFKAEGIDVALEILYNPYRFLDDDEKAAYDAAEEAEDKIIAQRAVNESGRETISSPAGRGPSLAQVKQAAGSNPIIVRRRST